MKTVAQMLRKKQREQYAQNFQFPLPKQLMGIEIECEVSACRNMPSSSSVPMGWTVHSDGSLRHGREFVLAIPLSGDALAAAIHAFFESAGTLGRALTSSTHIHLDMLDDVSPEVLQTLILMVYVLEPGIFQLSDPGREWTGYTNRLSTADDLFIAGLLDPRIGQDDSALGRVLELNGSRYYGLNLKALTKYGSLEFRYFPTCTSREELFDWVGLVQTFKLAATNLGNVQVFRELLNSEDSYISFLNTYFGKWVDYFLKAVPYTRAVKECDRALSLVDVMKVSGTGRGERYSDIVNLLSSNKGLAKFAEKNKPKTRKNGRAGSVVIYVERVNGGIPHSDPRYYSESGYAVANSIAVSGRSIYVNNRPGYEGYWETIFSTDRYSVGRSQIPDWLAAQSITWVRALNASIGRALVGMEVSNSRATLHAFGNEVSAWLVNGVDRPVSQEDVTYSVTTSEPSDAVVQVSIGDLTEEAERLISALNERRAAQPTQLDPTRGTTRVVPNTYQEVRWDMGRALGDPDLPQAQDVNGDELRPEDRDNEGEF